MIDKIVNVSISYIDRVTVSARAHSALEEDAQGPADIMGEVKIYKRAEVAERNGRAGAPLWIIYKDSIYDVTRYVNEHPGGLEPIADEAGGDASRAFEDVGHSKDARDIMSTYKIGEIVEEEKKYDASGKKRKVVADAGSDGGRSCISIITCGLLGS